MKKFIITLLTLSILLLTGCNNKPQQTEEPVTPPQNEITEPEKIKHELTDEIDTQSWNAVGGLSYDFDSDGEEDNLQIFSSLWFKQGEKPELSDGANWMITVTTAKGVYKLYEGFLNSGLPEISIGELYNEEPEKVIILTLTTGAGKSVTHYTFSDGIFYEELAYSTDNFTKNGANIVDSIEW